MGSEEDRKQQVEEVTSEEGKAGRKEDCVVRKQEKPNLTPMKGNIETLANHVRKPQIENIEWEAARVMTRNKEHELEKQDPSQGRTRRSGGQEGRNRGVKSLI